MGLITSRLNLEGLRPGRRRSQQEETLYSYSLNKNYFSNYFLMGNERFEVNNPDYLFGDNCDLNFLTCTKPYSLPYKAAQQNLLAHLNSKQKATNKVSSRVNSLTTPLNILTGRNRQVSQSRKQQDAQTQTLNRGLANGPEPSQPLVMLISIRKETLKLVKSSSVHNIDSDQNSLVTKSNATPERGGLDGRAMVAPRDGYNGHSAATGQQRQPSACASDSHQDGRDRHDVDGADDFHRHHENESTDNLGQGQSDSSSVTSNTLSSAQSTVTSKSGYTSVKDVPPSDCASDENDECYQDALNEAPTMSAPMKGDDHHHDDEDDNDDDDNDDDSDPSRAQAKTHSSTKDNLDIRITINPPDQTDCARPKYPGNCDMIHMSDDSQAHASRFGGGEGAPSAQPIGIDKSIRAQTNAKRLFGPESTPSNRCKQTPNRVYNIEFTFDTEVDCSIRIFYFCTREVTSNTVSYKPQHATYKSKTYTYKRGLNQRFNQQEHTFQPYLFDEDLLIYKPLDTDGNYNSGAVFPIVIHMVALEGPSPRQSQSLVATVEKSQLDESYSIKALKQLIFVDGVQYILQDIYGIENRPLNPLAQANAPRSSSRPHRLSRQGHFRTSCASLCSTSNLDSNLNLSDTASIASVLEGSSIDNQDGDASLATNPYKSLGSDNNFECVICMSDERDTMLLPCRHLCLCSSCAQSLRYQASSCPICRCPFKAALNLRVIQRSDRRRSRASANASSEALATQDTSVKRHPRPDDRAEQYQASTTTIVRRESITSPATPLLSQSHSTNALVGGAPDVASDERDKITLAKGSAVAKNCKSKLAARLATSSRLECHPSGLVSQSARVQADEARARGCASEGRSAAEVALEMQTMVGQEGGSSENARS